MGTQNWQDLMDEFNLRSTSVLAETEIAQHFDMSGTARTKVADMVVAINSSTNLPTSTISLHLFWATCFSLLAIRPWSSVVISETDTRMFLYRWQKRSNDRFNTLLHTGQALFVAGKVLLQLIQFAILGTSPE